jgi:CRP-like cAMP-binding protein
MKLSRKDSCDVCQMKCDIYEAIVLTGRSFSAAKTIQAQFKKHEKICKQGENVSHAIYLVGGTAKLYIEGINGHNIILYLMKPPSYIGLLSFFESIHYTYSVSAIEDAKVCMVDLDFLKELYLENHEVLLNLSVFYGSNSYRLSITRKELGEMSAISEENTVRLLTELRRENIIKVEGRDIEIVDKLLLKKISDLG